MVEASDFTPALICNYTTTTAATLDQGGGKRRGSFSDVDFPKSESLYDHPAYWPSSIQHLVQLKWATVHGWLITQVG
jgi:hypothetical protein